MKPTLKERFLMLIGYRYVANRATWEIHRLTNPVCHATENMADKNKLYLKEKEKDWFIQKYFNGCRFCLPEDDLG